MSWSAYNAVSAGERDGNGNLINVLFLACVVARGGAREGASQWWNVQGPHSPSRTLSVSKLNYEFTTTAQCNFIVCKWLVSTSTLAVCLKAWQSVTVQEWMNSRVSPARCIDRKLIECTLLIAAGGGGAGANPALSVCPAVCLAWNRLIGSQDCFLVFIFTVTSSQYVLLFPNS